MGLHPGKAAPGKKNPWHSGGAECQGRSLTPPCDGDIDCSYPLERKQRKKVSRQKGKKDFPQCSLVQGAAQGLDPLPQDILGTGRNLEP